MLREECLRQFISNGLFYTSAYFPFHVILLSFGSTWECCKEGNKKIVWFCLLLEDISILWILGYLRRQKLRSCRRQEMRLGQIGEQCSAKISRLITALTDGCCAPCYKLAFIFFQKMSELWSFLTILNISNALILKCWQHN